MSAKKRGQVKAGQVLSAPLKTKSTSSLGEKLLFSFEFYDEDNGNEYCLSKFNATQVRSAVKVLGDMSGKTLGEMQRQSGTFHFHEVYWEKTIKKNGYQNSSLKELQAFQFSLVGVNATKARVYGAMARNVFYIVWFDLEHKIWPTFKKNT